MSEQDEPAKAQAKARPEVPPKPPAPEPEPAPSAPAPAPPTPAPAPPTPAPALQNLSEGKVKSIVNKFSRQDSVSNETEQRHINGSSKVTRIKRLKRPPTVKPKPKAGRASLPPQMREQAPPLPMKRSRKPKEAHPAEEDNHVHAEGSRSEPDGKEVEVALAGGAEAEGPSAELPPPSSCERSCSCLCHRQRPGMKLIWVPVEADAHQEEEKEEEEEEEEKVEKKEEEEEEADGQQSGEDGEEWEEYEEVEIGGGEVEAEEEQPPPEEEDGTLKQAKGKFQQSLDILMAEGQRRLSDPGPHSALSIAIARSQSPPIPPKHSQPVQIHIHPSVSEEENIYEATLPVVGPPPRRSAPACRELDIPLIKVRKPARRSKLSYSSSDPTSEFQLPQEASVAVDTVPPAIPPRVPLTPVHRGGILLPQPTLEEWRVLRPSSPGRLSPQRAVTPPPLAPLRPAPPPPLLPPTNPPRLSSASLQSLPEKKEEKEEDEGEKEEELVDRRGSLQRQPSFTWESRLQDEPLYQTYRASVITQEIRRQTVCRNISKTSMDFSGDWAARQSGTGAGNGARGVATPGQSTLWRDLASVRESGVLERLTPEECKYQESMFEVLTSETSYLRSLRVLIEHFHDNRDLEETMIIRDKKTLFSSILRIQEVSERFLKDLDDRIFEEVVFSDICDIIHYHAQHNFPAYIDYVRNQFYQEKAYTRLTKKNAQFAAMIALLQESPRCQRLPFMSFLMLPFQRITRLKMLVENILKRTKEGTKEEQTASKALASLSKMIEECNTQVGKMRQMEELILLSHSLEFDKLKAIPVISQTRYLEKKGELQEMAKGATIFNMRMKFNPVHLFLFNDLLIIAAKKGAERFVVLDHAHRSLVQAQPLEEGPYEHCFNLTLLENHQGRTVEKLLKAPSQSDVHRWMAAFPNPTNPDREDDEVIYDDWDCPQVQCVEQYTAQQTDELTLEPTEIVNVIRKTNEGMYEGVRLSDGQKGWFPVGNVIEITNEHVRRRNLRERYRVLKAASRVTKMNTIS